MSTAPAQDGIDQQALDALAKVKLGHFTASPPTVDAFVTSTLSWQVEIPRDTGYTVVIALNGTAGPASGSTAVTPDSTTSYQLTARVLRYSRILGTVTVDVDQTACISLSGPLDFVIPRMIEYQINEAYKTTATQKSSGLKFRTSPGVTMKVQGNRLAFTLALTQDVNDFPDPSVDVDFSFALGVVPIPRYPLTEYEYHKLAPVDEEISVNVSVAWWAWLIPMATVVLPIVISGGEDKGGAAVVAAINAIVDALNEWFDLIPNVQPPLMDKHNAGFEADPEGDSLFFINFCPAPSGNVQAL